MSSPYRNERENLEIIGGACHAQCLTLLFGPPSAIMQWTTNSKGDIKMPKCYSAAFRCPESKESVQFVWDSHTGILQAEASQPITDDATASWIGWINRRERICKDIGAANLFALRYGTYF